MDMDKKSMDVSMGKNKLENVVGVYANKYKDYEGKERMGCSVTTAEEKDGVMKEVTYMHNTMPEAKRAEAENRVVDRTIAEWVGFIKDTDVKTEISQFLTKKLA